MNFSFLNTNLPSNVHEQEREMRALDGLRKAKVNPHRGLSAPAPAPAHARTALCKHRPGDTPAHRDLGDRLSFQLVFRENLLPEIKQFCSGASPLQPIYLSRWSLPTCSSKPKQHSDLWQAGSERSNFHMERAVTSWRSQWRPGLELALPPVGTAAGMPPAEVGHAGAEEAGEDMPAGLGALGGPCR